MEYTRAKDQAMAAILLSATAKSPAEQKAWSAKAIGYGREALAYFLLVEQDFPAAERDESFARMVVALGLNRYQGGGATPSEIDFYYSRIRHQFLKEKDFHRHKVMRALHRDGIIDLPGCYKAVQI